MTSDHAIRRVYIYIYNIYARVLCIYWMNESNKNTRRGGRGEVKKVDNKYNVVK